MQLDKMVDGLKSGQSAQNVLATEESFSLVQNGA